MSLNLDLTRVTESVVVDDVQFKFLWSKANDTEIANYQATLDDCLDSICVPWEAIHCNNLFCSAHVELINKFYCDITNAYMTASEYSFPQSNMPKRKVFPGWNIMLKSLKEESLFWHRIWKSNGCPEFGVIADLRKNARSCYHSAIRKAKRNQQACRAQKMATSVLQSDHRQFWSEVKKINSTKSQVPTCIDGVTGKTSISEVFENKYKTLFNSVGYDDKEMDIIRCEIKSKLQYCSNKHCYNSHQVDCEMVSRAIKKLKVGKSDGNSEQVSDHFVNGTTKANAYLSMFFKSVLTHGVIPDVMLMGTVIPIPKNKRKSLNDSNNYRGITLSSIMGKILDNILLFSNTNVFSSSDLQFGFKEKHSTTHCTFVAQEVINYYTKNKSSVYCVLLDASQAFDRVEYVKLFKVMLNKNICPVVARLLLYMYSQQRLRIRYSSVTTKNFQVTNGVKQGGILSPILFVLYMDVLFQRLQNLKIGCYIGNVFCGVLGYADDVLLMAPSVSSINYMLSVVSQYGMEFKIKFNASKTKLVICGSNDNNHNVIFEGTKLSNEQYASHLGNLVGMNVSNVMIDKATNCFIQQFNYLLATFGYCEIDTKYRLFKSFCMPLYGCVLWNFSDNYVERFFVTWRKCVRRLLDIPYNTHGKLLHMILNDSPVEAQLYNRFLNFFKSVISSENKVLKLCGNLVLNGSGSTVCDNINYVRYKYNLRRSKLDILGYKNDLLKMECQNEYFDGKVAICVSNIIDLIQMKECPDRQFTTVEINSLIKYFCT